MLGYILAIIEPTFIAPEHIIGAVQHPEAQYVTVPEL